MLYSNYFHQYTFWKCSLSPMNCQTHVNMSQNNTQSDRWARGQPGSLLIWINLGPDSKASDRKPDKYNNVIFSAGP